LQFKMAAITKLANIKTNAFNGVLVPNKVGFDTKVKRVGGL
jgi:hypothetical protein